MESQLNQLLTHLQPSHAKPARRFGAALTRVLRAGAFTRERLRTWVHDDLMIAAYLQQRFAADERRQDLIADWVSDLRRRAQITIFEP